MKNKKILVIGDITVDESIFTKSVGLSLETPTMKTEFIKKDINLGAAANVAENVAILNNSCCFLSVMGHDEYTKVIKEKINKDIKTFFLYSRDRKNNVKTRYWIKRGDLNYKYLQVNRPENNDIKKKDENKFIDMFHEIINLENIDVVVIADYRTGILTKSSIQHILNHCKQENIITITNSQLSNSKDFSRYSLFLNSDIFVCNESEINSYVGDSENDIRLTFKGDVCYTMGSEGCKYIGKKYSHVSPGFKFNVVDTCGAGDAFIACLAVNIDLDVDSKLKRCNIWGGLSVTKPATEKPSVKKYLELLDET